MSLKLASARPSWPTSRTGMSPRWSGWFCPVAFRWPSAETNQVEGSWVGSAMQPLPLAGSWSPWPSGGLAPAPRPRPPRSSGRCRPQRSSFAAAAGPPPRPAALGQRSGGVLGLVAPDDHGEERRLLLPPAADSHPEGRPGDAALGVADLGVVGEVAGEADAGLGHGPAPFGCLAGRSALPLDRGDGGHQGMPQGRQGQAMEPTKSADWINRRPWLAQVPSRLAALAAGGWACQPRAARSLHPGRGGENEAPSSRAARRPVPGQAAAWSGKATRVSRSLKRR